MKIDARTYDYRIRDLFQGKICYSGLQSLVGLSSRVCMANNPVACFGVYINPLAIQLSPVPLLD